MTTPSPSPSAARQLSSWRCVWGGYVGKQFLKGGHHLLVQNVTVHVGIHVSLNEPQLPSTSSSHTTPDHDATKKLHAVVVLEHFLSEQCPLLQVCVCVCVCPLLQVCVCVHCSKCLCREHISLLVILCRIMHEKKNNNNSKPFFFFFYKTDNRLW